MKTSKSEPEAKHSMISLSLEKRDRRNKEIVISSDMARNIRFSLRDGDECSNFFSLLRLLR
jgi:hypothetical protein